MHPAQRAAEGVVGNLREAGQERREHGQQSRQPRHARVAGARLVRVRVRVGVTVRVWPNPNPKLTLSLTLSLTLTLTLTLPLALPLTRAISTPPTRGAWTRRRAAAGTIDALTSEAARQPGWRSSRASATEPRA